MFGVASQILESAELCTRTQRLLGAAVLRSDQDAECEPPSLQTPPPSAPFLCPSRCFDLAENAFFYWVVFRLQLLHPQLLLPPPPPPLHRLTTDMLTRTMLWRATDERALAADLDAGGGGDGGGGGGGSEFVSMTELEAETAESRRERLAARFEPS